MKVTKLLLLTVLMGMLVPAVHAAPPWAQYLNPDMIDLGGYIHALNGATDPQSLAIRKEIAEGPADLAKERATAQGAGIPLTATTPTVPAAQNAAPLYDQWWQLSKAKPLALPRFAGINWPLAYQDQSNLSPPQLAQLAQLVQNRSDLFDLLHQATDKPALAFKQPLWEHYAALREGAREIASESYLLAYQGHAAAAVTDQARGFDIARQLMFQPTVINFLVADAVDAITDNGLQGILYMAGPNVALESQVQQSIQSASPDLSLRQALIGQVAEDLPEFDQFRTATPHSLAVLLAEPGTTPPKVSDTSFSPKEKAFLHHLADASEAVYLHQMQQLIAAAALPQAQRHVLFNTLQNSSDVAPNDPVGLVDPLHETSQILTPEFGTLDQVASRNDAREQVLLAAAAVLAAKAQTGKFPDTVPGNFTDPFSGKPLGYRREGTTGFVVYSVGPQGTFDGGKAGQYKFTSSQVYFRYPGPSPQPVATADVLK